MVIRYRGIKKVYLWSKARPILSIVQLKSQICLPVKFFHYSTCLIIVEMVYMYCHKLIASKPITPIMVYMYCHKLIASIPLTPIMLHYFQFWFNTKVGGDTLLTLSFP